MITSSPIKCELLPRVLRESESPRMQYLTLAIRSKYTEEKGREERTIHLRLFILTCQLSACEVLQGRGDEDVQGPLLSRPASHWPHHQLGSAQEETKKELIISWKMLAANTYQHLLNITNEAEARLRWIKGSQLIKQIPSPTTLQQHYCSFFLPVLSSLALFWMGKRKIISTWTREKPFLWKPALTLYPLSVVINPWMLHTAIT